MQINTGVTVSMKWLVTGTGQLVLCSKLTSAWTARGQRLLESFTLASPHGNVFLYLFVSHFQPLDRLQTSTASYHQFTVSISVLAGELSKGWNPPFESRFKTYFLRLLLFTHSNMQGEYFSIYPCCACTRSAFHTPTTLFPRGGKQLSRCISSTQTMTIYLYLFAPTQLGLCAANALMTWSLPFSSHPATVRCGNNNEACIQCTVALKTLSYFGLPNAYLTFHWISKSIHLSVDVRTVCWHWSYL